MFRLPNLTAGSYAVTATLRKKSDVESVTVVPGADADVVLQVEK